MISPYTEKNKQACIALFLDVFLNEPWRYHWMTAENIDRYFTDMANTPCFEGMTYAEGGGLIGFCFGITSDYFTGKSFEIREIVVARKAQGLGHGGRMLNQVEMYLLGHGVGTITLATHRDIKAFDFYRKHDFAVAETTVYMSKTLIEL